MALSIRFTRRASRHSSLRCVSPSIARSATLRASAGCESAREQFLDLLVEVILQFVVELLLDLSGAGRWIAGAAVSCKTNVGNASQASSNRTTP